jgi:hypothetical protein
MSPCTPREWHPDEKPTLPGSPSTPSHPAWIRLALRVRGDRGQPDGRTGQCAGIGQAARPAGRAGAYATETACLPAAYAIGYALYLKEFDAQRNSFNAGLAVLQLRASLLAAHVDLYRALGGAWKASFL